MRMINETPQTLYKTTKFENLCTGSIFEVRNMICIKTIRVQEAFRTHVYSAVDLADGGLVTVEHDDEVHVLDYKFTYSLVADNTKKRGGSDA